MSDETPPKDPPPRRRRRASPARTKPLRSAWSGAMPPSAETVAQDTPVAEATGPDPAAGAPVDPLAGDVERLVADAVRVGYEVIGDNLRLGRAAAERLSAGTYTAADLPRDLGTLAKRYLQLLRDLGSVSFDLLEALLHDPRLKSALAAGKTAEPLVPPQAAVSPVGVAPRAVPLTCRFTGDSARASARPCALLSVETPTMLSIHALAPGQPGAPAITGIHFAQASDHPGLEAVIEIPPGQPAGLYHGFITEAGTGVQLAALTVEIAR